MIPFTAHAFESKRQQDKFIEMKSTLQDGEILEILDFAENYRTFYQYEPQSMHWQYAKVTIHPFVVYYKCVNCRKLVTETCICISKDLKRDSFAMKEYTKKVRQHLNDDRNLSLSKIIQFFGWCSKPI